MARQFKMHEEMGPCSLSFLEITGVRRRRSGRTELLRKCILASEREYFLTRMAQLKLEVPVSESAEVPIYLLYKSGRRSTESSWERNLLQGSRCRLGYH